jgi:8-oxo-dGTP diphosphatase
VGSNEFPTKIRTVIERDRPEIITIPDIVKSDEQVTKDRRLLGEHVLKASVLVLSQGRFVIVRHTDESGGEWNIAGGLVEPGESVEDAAVRETKEETGSNIRLVRAVAILRSRIVSRKEGGLDYYRVVFLATPVSGRMVVSDTGEIAEVRLVSLEELAKLVAEGRFQSIPTPILKDFVVKLRQFIEVPNPDNPDTENQEPGS